MAKTTLLKILETLITTGKWSQPLLDLIFQARQSQLKASLLRIIPPQPVSRRIHQDKYFSNKTPNLQDGDSLYRSPWSDDIFSYDDTGASISNT
jgi:hypothetical protein